MLPLFHVHGLGNGIHSWLISGCRMRLVDRFDHRTTPGVMAEFKPTLVFGVPTIYVRLLDPTVLSDEQARAIGARRATVRLRLGAAAGARARGVSPALWPHDPRALRHERGADDHEQSVRGRATAGRRGTPLPGVSARIVDESGNVLGDESVGEVEIRSPHLFSEYWRRPEATAAAFHDGWFRTGDLGVRSADGYYTLRGRRGDLIISGGFNIYPREIEELLLEDQRVREAAVMGVRDDVRGEVPIAYVVGDDSLDVAELEATCRAQLASFKVPRAFVRIDALPRTALGKVQKHLLPAWTRTASLNAERRNAFSDARRAELFPEDAASRFRGKGHGHDRDHGHSNQLRRERAAAERQQGRRDERGEAAAECGRELRPQRRAGVPNARVEQLGLKRRLRRIHRRVREHERERKCAPHKWRRPRVDEPVQRIREQCRRGGAEQIHRSSSESVGQRTETRYRDQHTCRGDEHAVQNRRTREPNLLPSPYTSRKTE